LVLLVAVVDAIAIAISSFFSRSGMLFHFFLFMLGVVGLLWAVLVSTSCCSCTRRQKASQNWAMFRTQ
jgi:ABC-type transport system involved in multi-copper enzyme maturation permease subunit